MEEDKAKDERYNTSLKIQFWKQPNKKKKANRELSGDNVGSSQTVTKTTKLILEVHGGLVATVSQWMAGCRRSCGQILLGLERKRSEEGDLGGGIFLSIKFKKKNLVWVQGGTDVGAGSSNGLGFNVAGPISFF